MFILSDFLIWLATVLLCCLICQTVCFWFLLIELIKTNRFLFRILYSITCLCFCLETLIYLQCVYYVCLLRTWHVKANFINRKTVYLEDKLLVTWWSCVNAVNPLSQQDLFGQPWACQSGICVHICGNRFYKVY